jgi:hypothetical protein
MLSEEAIEDMRLALHTTPELRDLLRRLLDGPEN